MADRRAVTGFTLIEVLLAMAVASLVILSGFMAYDYIMQNWQRGKQQFQNAKQDFMLQQLVTQALNNTSLKLVYPRELARQHRDDVAGFYFLGRTDGYTAVTRVSVQDPAYPAVYRLFREADPASAGHWQLVYEEALLKNFVLQHAGQQLPFNFRRVLMRGLTEVRFAYQGWPNLAAKLKAAELTGVALPPQEWLAEYDGMLSLLHPLAVQISADSASWQFNFEDKSGLMRHQLDTDL